MRSGFLLCLLAFISLRIPWVQLIQAEGYGGSEAGVQMYAVRWRKANKRPATFLPLEFEPGQDAQVDWGEAQVILAGVQQKVQVFVMHLS